MESVSGDRGNAPLPRTEARSCVCACVRVKKVMEATRNWLLNNQKTVLACVSTTVALRLVYNVCAQEGNGLQCIFWQKLLCHAAMLASVSMLMWVIKSDFPKK